jgi:ABC-2 type transport system ATP-binding protein
VLDEPTASLDPLQTEQIRDLLDALSADTSILLATHLLDDVRRLCGRVAVMRQGRLGAEHAVNDDIDLLTHYQDAQEAPA